MYTLMMFGLAAVMIIFIATITAGIILGTGLWIASLVQSLRPAVRAASHSSSHASAARVPAEGIS